MLLNTRGIRNSFRFGKVEVDFCPQGFPRAVPPRIEFRQQGREAESSRRCSVLTPQMAIDKMEISVSSIVDALPAHSLRPRRLSLA